MKIHGPEEYDYGVWRCEMGVKYQTGLDARYGSILYLGYDRSQDTTLTNDKFVLPKNISTFAENVMVKRNDSFTVITNDHVSLFTERNKLRIE